MRYIVLFAFLLVSVGGLAQKSLLVEGKDNCVDDNIKTVRLYKTGNENAAPVINPTARETLTLVFDDLSETPRRYYYSFTHCNADWQEDGLVPNDFLSGFPENPVNNSNFSYNTGVKFTNYSVTFPTGDTRFKISGNYLIKVFDESTRQLVFQKGFSIVEPGATIEAKFRSASMGGQNCNQQIEFTVNHPLLQVNDPFVNLKVRIEQNSIRLPNIENPVPAFSNINGTSYIRPDKNIFPGNNEYRAFDIRNLSFTGMGVNNIQVIQGVYRALLNEDVSREEKYAYAKDNNGRYVIGADRTSRPDTEADYVEVFFTLNATVPVYDGKVYLFGDFTNWKISDEFEVNYDPLSSQYQKNMMLKQGYYNYRYIVLRNNGTIDMFPFEGCFSETENEYTVYVYYRQPGENYDRLVGIQRLNSAGMI